MLEKGSAKDAFPILIPRVISRFLRVITPFIGVISPGHLQGLQPYLWLVGAHLVTHRTLAISIYLADLHSLGPDAAPQNFGINAMKDVGRVLVKSLRIH